MSEEKKMNIDERYRYLRLIHKTYKIANKPGKRKLLEEMEDVPDLHQNGSLG